MVPVAAQAAQVGRLRSVVHAGGIVIPADGAEYLVVAPEPARILELRHNDGDAVAGGDVLVRFEMPTAAQEVARRQADMDMAQAQVENARIAATRARDLAGRGLIARIELDNAERELADALAAVGRAEALRRLAEANAARAIVRAPFAGVVAKRFKAPGDVAQALPTDPVLRLVDPHRLEVRAFIPAADVARVVQGASARLASTTDGQSQTVRLSVVAPPNAAAAAPGTDAPARLAFAMPFDGPIDTTVQVDIDAEERIDVVFVTADALVQSGGETVVWIAAGDHAERRRVTTGVANEQGVEITSGLQRGELVITRGQTGLVDGALISVSIGGN